MIFSFEKLRSPDATVTGIVKSILNAITVLAELFPGVTYKCSLMIGGTLSQSESKQRALLVLRLIRNYLCRNLNCELMLFLKPNKVFLNR